LKKRSVSERKWGSLKSHGFLCPTSTYTSINSPGAVDTGVRATNDAGTVVGFFLDKKGVQYGFKAVPQNEQMRLKAEGNWS
jgi:hypothetical protein